MPYKTRAKKLTQETGAAKCVWKTRMGPWFAAVGLDEFLNSIQTCSSDMLQQLLDDVPGPVRAGLLEALQGLRICAHETLTEKIGFWRHVPWTALGDCYCCHGGPVEESQRVLAECCEEYDAAVDACQGAMLHRIAHRIFRPLPRVSTSIALSKTEAALRSIRSRMPACRTMPLCLWQSGP